jgi:TPR repeat protein
VDEIQDTNKSEKAKSFSILPPLGDNWCIDRPGVNGIIFSTNRFIGQYTTQPPAKEFLWEQSFIVMANTINTKDFDVSSPAGIKIFLEKWHRGAVTRSDEEGGWHVEFTPSNEPNQFKLIDVETEIDNNFNADCVRYKTITEESNNPSFPDWVFRLKNFAVVCRHPQSDNQLIHVMYSERRRKGYENIELSNKISAEAEHTIQSLEFIENGTSDEANFSKGWKAYNRGDYPTAIKLWTALAERGYTNAQNNLGMMYAKGEGVIQDYKAAVKWYTKAADQGNDNAQNTLGVMYAKGVGVIQDYKAAVKWYTKAADQGNAYAQKSLGWMYYKGLGVSQDYKAAVKWYTLSAEAGNADSYYFRGKIYQERLEYAQAINDMKKTITINPNHTRALNSLAWIQSTAKNLKYRDGEEAILHAKKAVSLTNRNDAMILETLAAAYAEDAQYEYAAETIREAISKLKPTDNKQFVDEIKEILISYEQGKKYY